MRIAASGWSRGHLERLTANARAGEALADREPLDRDLRPPSLVRQHAHNPKQRIGESLVPMSLCAKDRLRMKLGRVLRFLMSMVRPSRDIASTLPNLLPPVL